MIFSIHKYYTAEEVELIMPQIYNRLPVGKIRIRDKFNKREKNYFYHFHKDESRFRLVKDIGDPEENLSLWNNSDHLFNEAFEYGFIEIRPNELMGEFTDVITSIRDILDKN